MKLYTLLLAIGSLVGAVTAVQAGPAAAPSDPLSDLQGDFGAIVGEAFHRPDPIVATASPELGYALRTSLEIPGAAFASIMKPFADADPMPAAAASAPAAHRHARMHHHRAAAQG